VDIETVNWVRSGPQRIPVLKLLRAKPRLPSEIAQELNLNRASVSRILADLKGKGLVVNTKGKTRTITYLVTEQGRKLLDSI